MLDDPRIAALEALFVVTDLGTGRHRLTLPDIASGGWGAPDDGPVGTIGYVSRVKAALVGAILRRLDEAAPAVPDQAPADAIAIYPHERDWIASERVRMGDEIGKWKAHYDRAREDLAAAEVEAENARAALAAAEQEIARLRAMPTRGHEQLALFAPPAADPAGEAQRAASSGAAVSALVGAAADAPALPEAPAPLPDAYKPKPRACGTCGQTGHNARTCAKRGTDGI